MNENLRTVMKKQGNEWVTVRLSDINTGDTFIMFDGDTQVEGEWLAKSAPYLKDGVWGIVASELNDRL